MLQADRFKQTMQLIQPSCRLTKAYYVVTGAVRLQIISK